MKELWQTSLKSLKSSSQRHKPSEQGCSFLPFFFDEQMHWQRIELQNVCLVHSLSEHSYEIRIETCEYDQMFILHTHTQPQTVQSKTFFRGIISQRRFEKLLTSTDLLLWGRISNCTMESSSMCKWVFLLSFHRNNLERKTNYGMIQIIKMLAVLCRLFKFVLLNCVLVFFAYVLANSARRRISHLYDEESSQLAYDSYPSRNMNQQGNVWSMSCLHD